MFIHSYLIFYVHLKKAFMSWWIMMLLFYNHKMLINNTMDNISLFGLTRLKFSWISSKSHRYSYLFLTNVPTSLQSALKTVKCLPTVRETWVPSLGQEDPLETEMANHSSTLAWKIPWTEEPGGLQSMGSQRVGHDWATSLSLYCQTSLSFCVDIFSIKDLYHLDGFSHTSCAWISPPPCLTHIYFLTW